MRWILCVFLFYINMSKVTTVKIDLTKCGVDNTDTEEGKVHNRKYPWLGILFYVIYDETDETRAVTTVVLIHEEFVIGNAADIAPMPKRSFRDYARVLIGEGWERHGRRTRNYIVHPEYGETINTVALIHLRQPVRQINILRPICPAPERIRFPKYWVVKFDEELDPLVKRVLPVVSVTADVCRDFYISHNLYEERRRPSYVMCAVSNETTTPCVWNAGAALVTRDVWNRWQLLGIGVYGAGCGAPSRYLKMQRYFPWIEEMLNKFQRITISEINQHKYVLRSGSRYGSLVRFGDCDDYEMKNLIYRDNINLKTDNNNVKSIKHNITIYDTVEYSCVKFQLNHASASTQMRVQHFCPRRTGGPACYSYKGTRFDISVQVMFTENCELDIKVYGFHVNMTLLDIQEWRWEEGTYYEDFRLTPSEYRGPAHMTTYGFEPLDENMWVPDYDRWTVAPFAFSTTTEPFSKVANDTSIHKEFDYAPTPPVPTTSTRWRRPFRRWTKWYWDSVKFESIFTDKFWNNAGVAMDKWVSSWLWG